VVHLHQVEIKFAQLVSIASQAHKKKDNAHQVCTVQGLRYQHQKDHARQVITVMQVQQLLDLLMEFKAIYVHRDSIALLEVHHQ
jgi:hypothetical protein